MKNLRLLALLALSLVLSCAAPQPKPQPHYRPVVLTPPIPTEPVQSRHLTLTPSTLKLLATQSDNDTNYYYSVTLTWVNPATNVDYLVFYSTSGTPAYGASNTVFAAFVPYWSNRFNLDNWTTVVAETQTNRHWLVVSTNTPGIDVTNLPFSSACSPEFNGFKIFWPQVAQEYVVYSSNDLPLWYNSPNSRVLTNTTDTSFVYRMYASEPNRFFRVASFTMFTNTVVMWPYSVSVTSNAVYYGTTSGNYTKRVAVAQTTTNGDFSGWCSGLPKTTTNPAFAIVSNTVPGVRYYYAVTAIDDKGLESDLSAECSFVVPTPAVPAEVPRAFMLVP